MKIATKFLLLLLVCIMCFGTLIACGGDDTTTTTTTPAPGGSGGGGGAQQLDPKRYAGETAVLYYRGEWGPTHLWIKEDDVGSNQADVACVARIKAFTENTGINLTALRGPQDIYSTISGVIKGGDEENMPTVIFSSGFDAISFMFNAQVANLSTISTIDLTADCWHQNVNSGLSLWGNVYAASGYFDTSNFERVPAIYFDIDALETINVASIDFTTYPELAGYTGVTTLYEWAENGEWTYDKLIALSKLFAGVNGTVDGNGIATKTGFNYMPNMDMMVGAAGVDLIELDQYGIPTYDITNEDITKLNWLHQNIVYTNSAMYATLCGSPWNSSADPNYPNLFGVNHTALFKMALIYQMTNYAKYSTETTTFRFGMLPMPKYDEQQESYQHVLGAWFASYAQIPYNENFHTQDMLEFSGFVLQTFTEMGKTPFNNRVKTVFEAVIEDGLAGRVADANEYSEQDKKMLQIIMDNVSTILIENATSAFSASNNAFNGMSWGLQMMIRENVNWQTYKDNNASIVRDVLYNALIKLGLADPE